MKMASDVLRLPKRLSQIQLYKKLLCINQRVIVLTIAVGETAASHFLLFLFCLASIQETKIGQLLLEYGLDQMEREESYETPKFHGRSVDEIRFNNARKLANFRLITVYFATAYVGIYALCTLCLLIGTLKRRCELMLPWLIAHAFGYFLVVASVLTIYFTNNRLRCIFGMDNIWVIWFGILCFVSDMFMWYVVHNYYGTLKMMKSFTEEAVVSIPCPSVPPHFRKENMYIGTGGYKHLVSEISNPNYVV